MLKRERQAYILHQVNLHNKVLSSSLSDEINVSEDTIRRDLRLLRNLIYARHGRPFKSELLRAYFDAVEWYKSDEQYTDVRLTAVDRRNINLIRSLEDQLGGPLTDYDNKKEDGLFEERGEEKIHDCMIVGFHSMRTKIL